MVTTGRVITSATPTVIERPRETQRKSTFDYSIRVINNHAESTLTRAYREYVFTYKRGSVVSGTRDHITGGHTDSDQTKKEKKELYVQSLGSYFESSKLLALWSLYSNSCKLLLVISLFQRC